MWARTSAYVYLCLFSSVLHVCVRDFEGVGVCVCTAHSVKRADLVSHSEGLWSPQPTDHRIVALNGLQIIKQATPMERNAEADGRGAG